MNLMPLFKVFCKNGACLKLYFHFRVSDRVLTDDCIP